MFGNRAAAKIPIMATTIIISTRVKPEQSAERFLYFLIKSNHPLSLPEITHWSEDHFFLSWDDISRVFQRIFRIWKEINIWKMIWGFWRKARRYFWFSHEILYHRTYEFSPNIFSHHRTLDIWTLFSECSFCFFCVISRHYEYRYTFPVSAPYHMYRRERADRVLYGSCRDLSSAGYPQIYPSWEKWNWSLYIQRWNK